MTRIRSPGYPSIALGEAIDFARKIHEKNRRNITDREAAVKDMGYSGLTGQSSKMIADLSHYGLIERAGKGGVRVTDLAVRILLPRNAQEKSDALREAAYEPALFSRIKEQWPDGFASEHALRNFLGREGFAAAAVQPALKAYLETYGTLQQEGATESHGHSPLAVPESARGGDDTTHGRSLMVVPEPPANIASDQDRAPRRGGVEVMAGERVVFVEEGEASQYLKLIASGEISADMIEALEDFVKRQKKRLDRASGPAGLTAE